MTDAQKLCACGHALEDHHQAWYRGGLLHTGTECEHYGSNESGGLCPVHADQTVCEDWRCELEHTWITHCQRFTPA